MQNITIQNFIAAEKSKYGGDQRKFISSFVPILNQELQLYIPNWEIADLQVEENFGGTSSIYIWLHDQFAQGKEREVRIDFLDSWMIHINFLDDKRSLQDGMAHTRIELIGTVEFLASTARWFNGLTHPKILYTALAKGIDCETV